MALLIDSTSGTMLAAHHCYLLSDETFSEEEWEQIDSFSDANIGRIGKENGVQIDKSEQLLQAIADALWEQGESTEWNPDTIQAIADAIILERSDLYNSRTMSDWGTTAQQ